MWDPYLHFTTCLRSDRTEAPHQNQPPVPAEQDQTSVPPASGPVELGVLVSISDETHHIPVTVEESGFVDPKYRSQIFFYRISTKDRIICSAALTQLHNCS